MTSLSTKHNDALRLWRQERELGLQEAADILGVGRKTYWRYERGLIPAEKVLRLEKVTGIPRQKLRPDLIAIFVPTGDAA